jgi:hypothetical protein
MRRLPRIVLLAALAALTPALAGCENMDLDKFDFFGLSQKKPLPGERRALFPEGVPGVTQGIPREYQKDYVEQQQQQRQQQLNNTTPAQPAAGADGQAATGAPENKTAAVAPAENPQPKPKPKQTVKRKPKPVAPAAAPAEPDQAAQQQPGAWPAPAQQNQPPQAAWPSTPPATSR